MSSDEEVRGQKRMGTGMQVLAWLVLVALGIFFFDDLLGKQRNPNQRVQTQYAGDGAVEVILQRNRFGHYVTSGEINGRPVTFMLDTGATGVAIPEALAASLGLRRGAPITVQTANGLAVSYAATLDHVSVGDIRLHDVSAAISPGLQTDEILLGMSFLRHIEFTQRGDTLILRQFR